MKRAGFGSGKFWTIGIASLVAVAVILGIASVFIYRATLSQNPSSQNPSTPGASAPPGTSAQGGTNPAVSRGTYQSVPNQVLFATDADGKPNISGDLTNIKQGDIGDCYFLAALMTVAAREPATIENMVKDNGDGTYTVSFHSKYDGVPNPVQATVNGDLPYRRGKPMENGIENIDGKNVSWAAIIEKAWAAVNGNSYKGIDGTDLSNAQDHDVHNGLYAITGKVGVDRNPGGPMTVVSFEQMQQDFANGLVTLGTSNSRGRLVSDHSYAVLDVNASDQTVVVGNPEGGQSTLSFDTFQSTNINQYIAIPTYP